MSNNSEAGSVPAITVKNLNKIYRLYDKPMDRLKESLGLTRKKLSREHYALKNVNLEIKRGETVGIIGTNGSGKSTLLKIITGVLSSSSGDVTVNGRISALLELGAGFNMEYSGIENIYLNGTMTGFSKKEIDSRLEEILEFADIGEYVHQPVKTYSSGMFVRLAFALAINIDPEILIVDEALSVGDVFFQAKCYHKFEEFKKQGKTILFVSHDLSSISRYCDRVILLLKGEKLAEGSPKDMIDLYKQVLVGEFDHEASEHTGLEYGSGAGKIKEYGIFDQNGLATNAIIKGTPFTVKMKVEFSEDVPAPIFACSIKNPIGIEITGTNSMVEKSFLEPVKAGDVKEITFTQNMSLQGGNYLISLGVTGYEKEDFKVYHRLYDVMDITVISDKNTVGFYDMGTVVKVV